VEYAEDGKVIKGQERAVPKTKYAEDILESNHKLIWGSYYHEGKWGYGCCHSTTRNSYCTGRAGQTAAAAVAHEIEAKMAAAASGEPAVKVETTTIKTDTNSNSKATNDTTSSSTTPTSAAARRKSKTTAASDEDHDDDGDDRSRARRARREKLKKRGDDRRKSKTNDDSDEETPSSKTKAAKISGGPTDKTSFAEAYRNQPKEADMDSYYKSRATADDPMAKLKGKMGDDGLLEG
jgi:pre-mRNA-processing factor SLU7